MAKPSTGETSSAREQEPLLGKKDPSARLNTEDPDESSYLMEEGEEQFTTYTFSPRGGVRQEGTEGVSHGAISSRLGITDNMSYRTRTLAGWDAFRLCVSADNVIWGARDLWMMMLKLSIVALLISIITVIVVREPHRLKLGRFTEVSKFLNVAVGLLLGFFLSSSVTRWYSCVNGFLELLDAIRNLQMQLVALGVPELQSVLCLRWGFASGWLLYGQLLVEAEHIDTPAGKDHVAHDRAAMWQTLTSKIARIDKNNALTLLTKREASLLKKTRDPPGMMWMWVAAYIGRLAADGIVPGMATPTYGRIMNLCQAAHGGIRQVRASISVQAPFSYTHMLATLVHINNLINAVTFGVVCGVAAGVTLDRYRMHPLYPGKDASGREVAQDQQGLAVTFMYCFFGPLIYQALILIAMHLAQPFDSEFACIPFDRLLHQLEVDMCNGRDLVEACDFDLPHFTPPAPPAAAAKAKA